MATGLMKQAARMKIQVPGNQSMVALLGQRDELLKLVESAFASQILVRGNEITITGEGAEAEKVAFLFEELLTILGQGQTLTTESVGKTIDMVKEEGVRPSAIFGDVVLTTRGRSLAPKTLGQKRYVDAIRRATVTFAIGPAGTGKTYLAIALAVAALSERQVGRLILTRPAVEAGERLGFLPGDVLAKVDPYMRPLFDALYDMMDPERLSAYMERGTIEVAPLAFMRGRTLNDSFIILDEAQNTSPEQMQMFLTRLGFGSKVVVTGDVTQVDLPRDQASGLIQVQDILSSLDGVAFVRFGHEDVVRHKLVQRIVEAYRLHAEETGTERSR